MKSNFDRILSSEDVMRRRASFLQRIHVDGPLLIILLTLAAGSLFVLYSASGKNWDLLLKQATSFGIGLVSMFVIAQLEPRFMARWVPLGYVAGVLLLVVGLVASSEVLSTLISPLRIFSRTVLYSSKVKVLKFQLASSVGRPT